MEGTFAVGGIDDDIVGGDGEDGVCQVVAGEEPTHDGHGLLIATGALPVDQDDAVHRMALILESPNSYARPSLLHLLEMSEEKLRGNFVLHQLDNYNPSKCRSNK